MADEPVAAWREPLSRRVRRWARRHRTAVTAASVALLTAVVGLVAVAAVQARANSALNRALAQSEESRQQAEEVSTFLVETFRSPDPEQDGKEVKVVEILDRAVQRLDEDVAGSEATRGALLDALGQTYQGLGLPAEAVRLMERARAVREKALGPGHLDTIRTRCRTISLYADHAGRIADAVKLGEATLELAESRLGTDHPDTIECRDNLAGAYQADGQTERAIRMREEILRLREATLGAKTTQDHRQPQGAGRQPGHRRADHRGDPTLRADARAERDDSWPQPPPDPEPAQQPRCGLFRGRPVPRRDPAR